MSSLKDKMENYEVIPPANAWEKITAALDESHLQDRFPARLQTMEIMPPAGAWDKITAVLDGGDTEEAQYPSRLHAMEIDPPSTAWNKIAASLAAEEKPPAIVVNHSSRFRQVLRYAAAAVVIGAVALGILQWTGSSGKSATGSAIARVNTDQTNTKSSVISTPTISSPDNTGAANTGNDQAGRLLAKLDKPYKNTTRRNSSAGVQNAVYTPGYDKPGAIYTYNDHVPSVADRYIMLMTPDGNFIRMSKKWGNLVCCVSGEDPAADCKDQLKKWQEKMATSSLTTSAGNVMDLLNIVNSLDEGTDL